MSQLKVRIQSIHWKNIRSFDKLDAPEIEGEVHNSFPTEGGIYLQMPNGTGKTTTLDLLRSIFTGKLPEHTVNWRRIIGLEDKEAAINATSEFSVRLLVNDQSYRIKLRLDHEGGDHRFFTAGPHGEQQGWHPPSAFQRAFEGRRQLVELFIFNAETAREMREQTDRKLLRSAIREFGGFSEIHDLIGELNSSGVFEGGRLETVKAQVQDEIGRLTDGGGDAGRQQSWKNCLTTVDRVRRELHNGTSGRPGITKMQEELHTAGLRKIEVETRLQEIEDEYGRTLDNVEPLQDAIDILKNNRRTGTEKLLESLLNPVCTFDTSWHEMRDFHCRHQDANLPADVGRGWLLKLSEEECCICGTPFDDDMRGHIREHGEQHLDRQKMVSVSEMQSEFKEIEQSSRDSIAIAAREVIRIGDELGQKTTELETLYLAHSSDETAVERNELNDEKMNLTINMKEWNDWLQVRTTSNMEWLRGEGMDAGITSSGQPTTSPSTIQLVENLTILERIEHNLLSLLAGSREQGAIWSGLQMARDVLGTAVTNLNDELRVNISSTATSIWKSMPAAGSERNLSLRIEDDGMVFYRGNNTWGGVSSAQSVSACYSLAQAIARLGQLSVPLVSDTPFSGFDKAMVYAWYGTISDTFNQHILLINTLEKEAVGSLCYDDYCASIHQTGMASDGGRKFIFDTDFELFKTLEGPNDTLGGDD
jgi:DNA sulfur modification protein DndD